MINKKCRNKKSNNFKREDNQTPTFYIIVESIDDFITKSQKQGAKKIINKNETSEGLMLSLQDQQQNTFLVYGKAKNS